MTSDRARHTLGLVCCLLTFSAQSAVSAGQAAADIEASAGNGRFLQAFVQARAVVLVAPSLDGITHVRAIFARYPQIQEAGVSMIGGLIDAARTEQDLLGAQSELRYFAKLVNFVLCDPGALAALQARFLAAASTLILDTGIPVTFESNLLADWAGTAGTPLDTEVERRIYRNTMANIAARNPRDTPSVLMADRLFRYLLREPEARAEPFATLEKVEWEARDLDGPMRLVYPELVKKRRAALGLPESNSRAQDENREFGSSLPSNRKPTASVGTGQSDSSSQSGSEARAQGGADQYGSAINFDTRGVVFGPWVRRFIAQVKRNWMIPDAARGLKGHVLVSFNVHKDGTVTDIVVAGASKFETLDTSSFNAIAASNPTQPLPPEYPEEKAFFTVTFYYNETPGQK